MKGFRMEKRLRKFLLYPLAAALPALGLMIGLGVTGAQASTTPSASAGAAATAKAAIKQLLIGDHGVNHRVSRFSKKVEGLNQVESTNWSGYADTGSGFSKVSGSWTEPSASCGGGIQLAAFWVGIDGYNSGSVEQDGTMIECYYGGLYQFSWWEMYPSNAVQVVGTSVASGDHISASVVRSGTSYSLSVTDSTHPANSFTTNRSCSGCANSSAEWIAEAPSGSNGLYPLAHFSTWTLSNASVSAGSTSGTISRFPDNEITMVNNSGQVKAQPGPLNSSGSSFSVTWERSS
jgi:hypothetical protein